jgi:hypothetical protein
VADDQPLDLSELHVYFEKNRVIDAVAIKADANEVGPKPAIR